jgi:hypothetical protein
MSSNEYTPTHDEVREDFAYPWEGFQQDREGRLAAFDRWMAKHDAEVAAPAAPPVGEEMSGPETDSQAPASETSLGDSLRAFGNAHSASWPLHGAMRRLTDRADALEHDRDQWRESAEFAAERLDRLFGIADDTYNPEED